LVTLPSSVGIHEQSQNPGGFMRQHSRYPRRVTASFDALLARNGTRPRDQQGRAKPAARFHFHVRPARRLVPGGDLDQRARRAQEAAMTPMEHALTQARAAAARREVPVGAVVIGPDGTVLAARGNEVEARNDASAHAEMLALRDAAAARGSRVLADCDLHVTLEPCPMCAHAISLFRIRRLVFGAYDPKGGGVEHGPRLLRAETCFHRPEIIGGVREQAASVLLRAFFASRRHGG